MESAIGMRLTAEKKLSPSAAFPLLVDLPATLAGRSQAVLAVVDSPEPRTAASSIDWREVCLAGDALELMKSHEFALVVVAAHPPDMPAWMLVRSIRTAWPWQKWIAAGIVHSQQDEVEARSLGVLRILDQLPGVAELGSVISRVRTSLES